MVPSKEVIDPSLPRKKRSKQQTAETTNDDEGSFCEGLHAPGANESKKNLSWGRGIKEDWDRTVGTYWLAEMTNIQQKTIAVTL